MPQSTFKAPSAAGSADIAKKIKDAGSAIADVKWVNVNPDGLVVVTHGDGFSSYDFLAAVKAVDGDASAS